MTNTLPIRPEQEFDKLTVLSIAPLLGQAIKEVFEDGSVTSLFAGRSDYLGASARHRVRIQSGWALAGPAFARTCA